MRMRFISFLSALLLFLIAWDAIGCESISSNSANSSKTSEPRRRLQFEDFVINSLNADADLGAGGRSKRGQRRKGGQTRPSRAHVFSTTVDQILVEAERYHMWWTGPSQQPIVTFSPAPWSAQHRSEEQAIFTASVLQGLGDHRPCSSPRDLVLFLGSARRVFSGDIVLAMDEKQLNSVTKRILTHYQVVVYLLPSGLCATEGPEQKKHLYCGNEQERVPATVFRYYFYEKWAAAYSTKSSILITDFRDVFFQSNPFVASQVHFESDLALFYEFYPTMIIKNCRFNRKVMEECYGGEGLQMWGGRPVVSSGGLLGTRNGVLVWTHFMTRQLQDAPGRSVETRCTSGGVDHAFVNYLAHGNKLRPFLRIRHFLQGEGAFNSLGGMWPDTVEGGLRGRLGEMWGALRNGSIFNWDGSLSPIVHQIDHFVEELRNLSEQSVKELGREYVGGSRGVSPEGEREGDVVWQALQATRCLFDCKSSVDFFS